MKCTSFFVLRTVSCLIKETFVKTYLFNSFSAFFFVIIKRIRRNFEKFVYNKKLSYSLEVYVIIKFFELLRTREFDKKSIHTQYRNHLFEKKINIVAL